MFTLHRGIWFHQDETIPQSGAAHQKSLQIQMFDLANGYLAEAAMGQEYSHAPQLHLVAVGDLPLPATPL